MIWVRVNHKQQQFSVWKMKGKNLVKSSKMWHLLRQKAIILSEIS